MFSGATVIGVDHHLAADAMRTRDAAEENALRSFGEPVTTISTPPAWPRRRQRRRPRPSSRPRRPAASRSRRFFFGLALLGFCLRLALGQARGVEEARHAVGRLRADAEPVLDALEVELDAVGVVLGQQRIVRADLLDVAPVARRGGFGHDDVVVGPLLGAPTREADFHGHACLLVMIKSAVGLGRDGDRCRQW